MKITEETKIKDLIPEGYELEATHEDHESVVIQFRKKPVKDFDYYVEDYHNEADRKFDYAYAKVTEPLKWPWELRVGLLKYICNDIDFNFWVIASVLDRYDSKVEDYVFGKVLDICPREFLESIFKK